MHGLTSLVLQNLRSIGVAPYPIYEEVLSYAVESEPPPFAENWFGRRYFELARQADWFANSLIANAALEGYGARQIWKFANKIADEAHAVPVRRHSLDESRHSTMFISMLRLVFPGATLDGATKETLEALQPRFSPRDHPPIERAPESDLCRGEALLNELIQVHITEIRALVLQLLLRPALLAYSPSASRKQLAGFSAVLVRDEARHIEYTARIFEDAGRLADREFLFYAFRACLREFNALTMIELERDTIRT